MIRNHLPFEGAGHWIDQYGDRLLRWFIIACVLFVSAFVVPRAPMGNRVPFLLVGLAVVVAGGIILLRRPYLGVLGLVIASQLVPIALGTGTQTEINAAVLCVPPLLALWLFDMLRKRDIRLARSRMIVPLVAFEVVVVLSFIAGRLPWFPTSPAPMAAQIGALVLFFLSAGAFLVVGHQLKEMRWLQAMTWIFIVIGAIYIVGRQFTPLGFLTKFFPNGSNGGLFWVWLVALAGGQAVFNRSLGWIKRIALSGVVGLTFAVAWFQGSFWVSGWLPPLVVVLALVWLRSWRLGLALSIVGFVVVVVAKPELIASVLGTDQYSIDTREVARDILLEQMLPVSPILGFGPANYYWYTPLFPILGYSVQFNSHNQYVDIVMQSGLVGLACFAWFVVSVGLAGWELRKQTGSRFPSEFPHAYVNCVLAGLVGTLVLCGLGDWLLPFVYNVGFTGFRASLIGWIFMGGLLAMEQFVSRPQTALATVK